ncbi:MAG: uracil-DNA glycosylase [Desulfatiglandales bacterium]
MAICHHCRYYYVTWEKETPHGCKAYGFKSALLPYLEVKLSVREGCIAFEKKEKFKIPQKDHLDPS